MTQQYLPESQPDPIPDWMTQETTMTEQQRIDSDFDDASNFGRAVGWVTVAFLFVVLAWCASATAQAANTATITYTAPTTRTDGSNIAGALSYEVWQGVKGATKTKVGTISATNTTISTGLLGNTEYCWHIVVIEANNPTKSAASNEACKAFAQSGPNVVTITVT